MKYVLHLLGMLFVLGFVGLSSKPSPIYGGVSLIVSGGVGCGLVMYYGGSFLGLMVFLIYLGGMLVVFGYTTAMATEEHPESWGSSAVVWGALMLGVLVELLFVLVVVVYDKVEVVIEFKNTDDWLMFWDEALGLVREDSAGVAAMYSCGNWLVIVGGWSLLVTVFIVIEITRGG